MVCENSISCEIILEKFLSDSNEILIACFMKRVWAMIPGTVYLL